MSIIPDHMDKVEQQAIKDIIDHVLKVEEQLTRADGTAYGDILIFTPEERVMWYLDLATRPSPEFNILTFLPDIDEMARTAPVKFVGQDAQELSEQFEIDFAKVELPNA